jgi:hypothetical protein
MVGANNYSPLQTKLFTKTTKIMKNLINFGDDVSNRIITIRNQNVLLDNVVAELYGVETKRVNEAIKNNPEKFPEGYVFKLKANEFDTLKQQITSLQLPVNHGVVENIDHPMTISNLSRVLPTAFTEKGLYMLATILKSPQATRATIEIVEAFAKLKELQSNIAILNSVETEVIEPEVVESTSSLIKDLLFSHFPITSSETSVEFNIGVMKGKRTIKSEGSNVVQKMQNRIDKLEQTIEIINQKLDN